MSEVTGAKRRGRPVDASGVTQITTQKKSKRQQRRERRQSVKICRDYWKGKCEKQADACRFSHDLESYLHQKPAPLPGTCIFEAAQVECPFGVTCCYEHGCETEGEGVKLPALREVVEVKNSLPTEVRQSLRDGSYDYSRADDVLTSLGVDNPRSSEKREGVEVPPRPVEKRRIDFGGKTYLAPLTTLGNLPFRRTCVDFGVDVTCGEMAVATNLLRGQQAEWALLKRHPSESIFGVQICGGYADALTRCAQLVEDVCEVDFIDVNLGCPIDSVCHRGAGASLLLRPKRIQTICNAMTAVMRSPLTLKLRKGYHDNSDVVHNFVPKLAEWGAAAVTLHGRTRAQRYTKLADWAYIYSCAKERGPIQMIGNGDVFSFTEWEERLAASEGSLATCMIGRAALIKPWIFTEIKEHRHWDISSAERLEMLKVFCSRGLEHWGSDQRGVETTRRFLLEWLSFLHRYVPVGLLEVVPQTIYARPDPVVGRNDLEALFMSDNAQDWVRISEMLLGPAPQGFTFCPKHKSNAYAALDAAQG